MFEGSAKDIVDDLEANLMSCGALLLLYGSAPPAWVRAQLLRYSKLEQLRDAPPQIKTIVLGPPAPKAELAWSGGFEKVDCQDGDLPPRIQIFRRIAALMLASPAPALSGPAFIPA